MTWPAGRGAGGPGLSQRPPLSYDATVAPPWGPTAGGNTVTAHANVSGTIAIYVDGVLVPHTVIDSSHWSIVMPPHASGATVVSINGTIEPGTADTPGLLVEARAAHQVWYFYADPPVLIALDPAQVILGHHQEIDIAMSGEGFDSATETQLDTTLGLYWGVADPPPGQMYAGHWHLDSDNMLTLTGVPASGGPGPVYYAVKTLAGMSNSLRFDYVEEPIEEPGWPGLKPHPANRGIWKLTLHARAFKANVGLQTTVLAEIVGARSRRLERKYNGDATLTFTLDGSSDAAAMIAELQHEVVAWRWDDMVGRDVAVFRGVISQSQDTISEQANSVNFTAHDHLAMLSRRALAAQLTFTQWDQDNIVTELVRLAKEVSGFTPGSHLPLVVSLVNPAGGARNLSSKPRDRTYEVGQKLDEAVTNLSAVEGGFDYDVVPNPYGDDQLRIFYPYQGELRRDLILEYGSTVASLSRSVNSTDYANYWRVIGQAPEGAVEGTPPLTAVASSPEANNASVTPVGLWQSVDNASDVNNQNTLNEKARADLSQSSLIMPAYSLELRPGVYHYGAPKMGDTVQLIVHAGRLKVNTDVRVVGIAYDITDDDGEVVKLEVGRPDIRWRELFTRYDRDINALARR